MRTTPRMTEDETNCIVSQSDIDHAIALLSINALPARTVTTTKIKPRGADHLWDTEDVSMIEYTGAWTGRAADLVIDLLRDKRHESSTNNTHRQGSVFRTWKRSCGR
jgi:hypothetical protein